MRIVALSRVFPPNVGGAGSFLHSLCQILAKKGIETTIITANYKKAPKEENLNGVKIRRCFSLNNQHSNLNLVVNTLGMAKYLAKELKEADIIHAHDMSAAGLAAALLKKIKKFKQPYLQKYGGDLVFEYLSLKRIESFDPKKGLEETLRFRTGFASLLHKLQDFLFGNADFVLPDAHYGKNFLIKRGLERKKIFVLANGVDTEKFRPMPKKEARRKLNIKTNKKIVFTAARLVEWKGIDVLIDAFAKVKEEFKDALLFIAGSGEQETTLKKQAKKQRVDKNIFFIGNISREDMPLYLNAIDIFVLPSYFDTTPNVLLEAMASAKACVVSNIGGIKEVVKDTALKAKPGDAEGFAKHIGELLSNSNKRNKLGKKALSRIKKSYSMSVAAKNYFNFYRKVLK